MSRSYISCPSKACSGTALLYFTFLHVEGSFDRTSFGAIAKVANRYEVETTICRWINFMLESKSAVATLPGETLEKAATMGCPQEGE
jgi:hypothetical protein